jgi:hypothetical protein
MNENNIKIDYLCNVCGKIYTTKWYYDEHVSICKPKKKQPENATKKDIEKFKKEINELKESIMKELQERAKKETIKESKTNNENLESDGKGCIYVLTNPSFKYECYKIGQTNNLKRRLTEYKIYYPEECNIVFTSDRLDNYKLIEKAIHLKLKEYNALGEFFKCSIDIITNTINEIIALSEEELIYLIRRLLMFGK